MFMQIWRIQPTQLARKTGIPVINLIEVIENHRSIDAKLSWYLSQQFHTPVHFWLRLQESYNKENNEESLHQG